MHGRRCPCICLHFFWNGFTACRFSRRPGDLRWYSDLLRCSGHFSWEPTECKELNSRWVLIEASEESGVMEDGIIVQLARARISRSCNLGTLND